MPRRQDVSFAVKQSGGVKSQHTALIHFWGSGHDIAWSGIAVSGFYGGCGNSQNRFNALVTR
jgi:hypothetical protein